MIELIYVTDFGAKYTAKEFFIRFAPDFNFELSQEELLAEGLKQKFITLLGEQA